MGEHSYPHMPICPYHWLWDPTLGFFDEIVDFSPATVRQKLVEQDPRYLNAASHMFHHWLWHGLHYGTSVIEGIRVYPAAPSYLERIGVEHGMIIFRGREHIIDRLAQSRALYPIGELPFAIEQMFAACCELVIKNNQDDSSAGGELRYLRPIITLAEGLGVDPTKSPVAAAVLAVPWKRYLQEFLHNDGAITIRAHLRRAEADQLPVSAKGSASYVQGAGAKRFARAHGAAEALLGAPGPGQSDVSEASGMNIFIICNGVLSTPSPEQSSCLDGYTRRTILRLARDVLGWQVTVEPFNFVRLKYADEVFMAGTATEITPVTMFDGALIGKTKPGFPGPMTLRLQELYHRVVTGDLIVDEDWLDFVPLPTHKLIPSPM